MPVARLAAALLLLAAAPAPAAEPDQPEDFFAPLKGIALSDRGDARLSIGGQARARYEAWNNFGFTDANDDRFLLTRLLLNAELQWGENLRFFAEGKTAWSTDRDLPGGRRSLDVDSLDLQQLFVDVRFDLGDNATLTVRPGRQALKFGAQRLVSPLPWSNTMRTWDGVSVIWQSRALTATAFVTQFAPVEKYGFNDSTRDDVFYGLYATAPLRGEHLKMDGYIFGRRREMVTYNGTTGQEDRYTLGGRLYGRCGEGRIDYDVEGAYQFGEVGAADVSAFFFASELGYTWVDAEMLPRLWVGFDYASGDDSAGGGVQTFDQLYPLGHAYFGFIDVVGRQNVVDLSGGVSIKPTARLKLAAAGHYLRRASGSDALYNAGGAVVRASAPGAGRELGFELDLTATYAFNDHLSLLVGYSRFFAGDFIDDTGSGDDIDFGYTQLLLTF